MLIKLLGPFQVSQQRQTSLSPRARSILAVLALSPNKPVSTARLCQWLWDENGNPDNPEATLQTYVCRLRAATKGEAFSILTHPESYLLRIDPDAIDVTRIEKTAAEATAKKRSHNAELLRSTLQLWRGPALCDLPSTAAVQLERDRLQELYLQISEVYFDFQVGEHKAAQIIGELRKLTIEHPYRESFIRQLMTCLADTGHRTEALQLYRKAYERLRDELGVEPGRELANLHIALLRDEPEPRNLPPTATDKHGIDCGTLPSAEPTGDPVAQSTKETDRAAAYASGTSPLVTVMAGPPGAGKTTAALRYGWAQRRQYPGGISFVSLLPPAGGTERVGLERGASRWAHVTADHIAAPPSAQMDGALTILDGATSLQQVLPWLISVEGHLIVTSSSQLHGLPNARRMRIRLPSLDQAAAMLSEMLCMAPGAGLQQLTRLAELVECNVLGLATISANIANHIWPTLDIAVQALSVQPRDRVAELECGELSVARSFQRSFESLSLDELEVLQGLTQTTPRWRSESEVARELRRPMYALRPALRGLAEANLLQVTADSKGTVRYRVSILCSGAIELLSALRLAGSPPLTHSASLPRHPDSSLCQAEPASPLGLHCSCRDTPRQR